MQNILLFVDLIKMLTVNCMFGGLSDVMKRSAAPMVASIWWSSWGFGGVGGPRSLRFGHCLLFLQR